MRPLKLLHHEDRVVKQIQFNTRDALSSAQEDLNNRIQTTPAAKGVSFATAGVDVVVPHTLGKVPNGYTPTNHNAPAQVYTSPTPNPLPQAQLILRASAPVTCDVLIF
jgi:hypothetical protein